tara:strand:- start:7708 stop:8826 length:1119 start_codon:yes stop_codon:yes gene_type:complete
MHVLVTGANGFVGKNLCVFLSEKENINIIKFTKNNSDKELLSFVKEADFIIHLAGVNRPKKNEDFQKGNNEFTKKLCEVVIETEKKIPIIFSSSVHAEVDNDYGNSKLKSEEHLLKLQKKNGNQVFIFRLPNIFGKWSNPNYNSVVATFCHNIINDLPIQINDKSAEISLVHIDDVVKSFINLIEKTPQTSEEPYRSVKPVFKKKVADIAKLINSFKQSRKNYTINRVGAGFERLLYSTYLSYLSPNQFFYNINKNEDERGIFSEMLKTNDSGQFSFFTAHPGITRGGHYHHIKNEKFLVVQGKARFRFKHLITGEFYEKDTSEENLEIVETCPGWSHDITNIGADKLIVLLWANEIFDSNNPDTVAYKEIK